MDVVIIFLYIFLIIIGAISIIGSISALSKNKPTETDSSIETKWFKWKAPVRLVFGLLCIISVIIINKVDFFKVYKENIKELEQSIEELKYENEYLNEKLNIIDSTQRSYLLILENQTGKSINQGNILISNINRELKIKGAELYSEEFNKLENNETRTETGDKFYLKFKKEIWGINIFESQYHNTTIKIEVYKETSLIKNNEIINGQTD